MRVCTKGAHTVKTTSACSHSFSSVNVLHIVTFHFFKHMWPSLQARSCQLHPMLVYLEVIKRE
jgi:hypothetical protein